jgi:hypothetical protein
MSLSIGSAVTTNGLVVYYDMSNTKKSWKGPPVTNYIPNPYASWNGSSFVLGYNYANLGATYTYVTGVENPINSPGVLEYFTGTSGYKYFSIDSTSLPATGTYTFSYYAKLKSGPANGNNAPIDSQLWRANGSDRGVTGDWNPTFTNEWRRYATTGPAEASTILQYFPVHSGNIIGGYTIQYCGFQLELNSYATAFVSGTRSATQAIVDVTGRNTLTTNSLTYPSDGTFSFNGSGNSLSVPFNSSLFTFNSEQTIIIWMKNSSPSSARRNPYNQAYAGGGTITHENDTNFNYYWGQGGGDNSPYQGFGSSFSVVVGETAMICLTRNASTVSWYKNGVFGNSTSNPYGSSVVTGTSPITIGSGYAGSFGGNIYTVMLYNRALSASEVQQNFNAFRGRYGL